ncbi:hypothetical protein [Haloferax chudinovii]|uniref:DUF2178 domain-containing protein n=1 Tax=Haloferax chudinovii TaxID=1109010 RepID=A0ABD5XBB9_9EURY
MSRQVRTTQRPSEKYWYTLAGYIALGVLGLIYFVIMYQQYSGMEGGSFGIGFTAGFVLIGISALGLGIYPALFKDSMDLRSSRSRWKPKWWFYIGGGFLTPLLGYLVTVQLGYESLGLLLAVVAHAFSATVTSSLYLYRRHKYVGIP